MQLAVDLTFFLGLVLYVAAALTAALYLRKGGERILVVAVGLIACGGATLAATFILRWVMWDRLPLTTAGDFISLFIVMATATVLFVAQSAHVRALLCFHTPALALLYAVNAGMGHDFLHEEPRELQGLLLAVHVVPAFLAYALGLVASLTGMAYIFQARNLKRLHTTGLFQKLPSLEELDRTLFRLISFGYVFFAVTFVLGMIWAYIDRNLLSVYWWLSPKIFCAAFMVVLYSAAFHSRRLGRLRGQKLGYLVFVGFTAMLAAYLALSLLNLKDYNFWGAAR